MMDGKGSSNKDLVSIHSPSQTISATKQASPSSTCLKSRTEAAFEDKMPQRYVDTTGIHPYVNGYICVKKLACGLEEKIVCYKIVKNNAHVCDYMLK
jgi:hypothetical protein